jgi:predicted GTPase
MTENNLVAEFKAFDDWRQELLSRTENLQQWLSAQDLSVPVVRLTFENLRTRLNGDRLIIAFVAEFSRGKSELINALFFSGYKQRLLPSSAGRTTMCPTELLYQASVPPTMFLLPVETRKDATSIADHKNHLDEWVRVPLNLDDPDSIIRALQCLSDVKYVPLETAHQYGFFASDEESEPLTNELNEVELPSWRHAVINFPHPLLEQGLVILDTPGLNAIGAEPDLTFSLLPGAHSVLYILAADAGVSKTDLAIWEQHLSAESSKPNHVVVLNKIDSMWDDLKSPQEIRQEIDKQVDSTAKILDIPTAQIFPLSAQKGLLAKISGDRELLARSRLPDLEQALTSRMLPARRQIVANTIRSDIATIAVNVRDILGTREDGLHEQLEQLSMLRTKNQSVIAKAFERSRVEKQQFEQNMARYAAMRRIFTTQINALLMSIDMNTLKQNAASAHQALERVTRSKNVQPVIDEFFAVTFEDLQRAEHQTQEIYEMVRGLAQHFAREIKIRPVDPEYLQFDRYLREIKRLQHAYEIRFEALWGRDRRVKLEAVQRFFEAIVTRAKYIYDIANRDTEVWLRNLLEPLEQQIRERHQQLRKHQESARRIALANNEVEESATEIKTQLNDVRQQHQRLNEILRKIEEML